MVRAKHAGAQFQIERTIRRARSLRGTVRRRRNRQKLEKTNATVGSGRLHGEERQNRSRGIFAARLIRISRCDRRCRRRTLLVVSVSVSSASAAKFSPAALQ